jgi:hypothetical protein
VANLLSEAAEIKIKGQANSAGINIKGAGASSQAYIGGEQARYNQQPVQQPRKQSVSYISNNGSMWHPVHQAPALVQPSYVQ